MYSLIDFKMIIVALVISFHCKLGKANVAELSPTSIQNGCPGDMIAVMCEVSAPTLIWTVPNPDQESGALDRSFNPVVHGNLSSLVGQRLTFDGDTLGAYAIILASVENNRFVSTLELTLYRSMNGRYIDCSGERITITLRDHPVSPTNIHIANTVNKSEESIVTFSWDSSNIGAPLNYSILIAYGAWATMNVSTLTVDTQIELSLQYNTDYTVMVSSTNCAGSSHSSNLTLTIVRCKNNSSVANGDFMMSNEAEGGTLELICHEGFILVGPALATCTHDSLWQPNLENTSHCLLNESEPNECSLLEPPSDGHLIDFNPTKVYITGAVVAYQCNSGFFPNDIKNTTCENNGVWTNIPLNLVCRTEPIHCKIPSAFANGRILDYNDNSTSLPEGSTISFSCHTELSQGSKNFTTTCNNSGEWSIELLCINNNQEGKLNVILIAALGTTGAIFTVIGFLILTAIAGYFQRNAKRKQINQRSDGGTVGNTELRYEDCIVQTASLPLENNHRMLRTIQQLPQDQDYDPVLNEDEMIYSRLNQPGSYITSQQTHLSSNESMIYSTLEHEGPKKTPRPGPRTCGNSEYADIVTVTDKRDSAAAVVLNSCMVKYSTIDIKATKKEEKTMPKAETIKDTRADKLLDLNQALVQLKVAYNRWRQIGAALHVPETYIEQVEPYCKDDNALGMREMIDFWTRNCGGPPTWRELSNSFKKAGEELLAKQIMDFYETGCLPNSEDNLSCSYNSVETPTAPASLIQSKQN